MLKAVVACGALGYGHLVFLAFWATLIAGYFYYGFIGEGDWECYATQDDVNVPWDPSDGDAPGDYHHVNANFQVVCIWGFFQYLSVVLLWLVYFFDDIDEREDWKGLAAALVGVDHFAHFITLMVMRWRHAGKVCSGDYETDVNRYSLFEANNPYLHNAGSFLFYAIISQFTGMVGAAAGIGLMGGV